MHACLWAAVETPEHHSLVESACSSSHQAEHVQLSGSSTKPTRPKMQITTRFNTRGQPVQSHGRFLYHMCQKLHYFIDHRRSGIVYNFGRVCMSVCLSVCMDVCLRDDNFQKP